jgi:RNA polymerase sigma-70 factor (ECF subfamily)
MRLRDHRDQPSWEQFHRRYGHMLYRYARARGATHADAEDVVQEVESQVVKTIPAFEYNVDKGGFRAYLRTAVVHALSRRARHSARQPMYRDPASFEHVHAESDDQRDAVWDHEWRLQKLRGALDRVADDFDPTALKAFEMHVLAGCSVADTASALEISIWSVYRARTRVLARLKAVMANQRES